jgi:hypothetical protein
MTMIRRVVALLLAAVGPFAIIWGGNAAAHALSAPDRGDAAHVTRVSSYVTAASAPALLGSPRVLWSDLSHRDRFVNDFQVVGGDLVLVTDSRLIVLDSDSGTLRAEHDLPNSSTPFQAPTTVSTVAGGRDVWVYSFMSGNSVLYSPIDGFRRSVSIESHLTAAQWIDEETIVASGLFQSALLERVRVPGPAAIESAAVASSLFDMRTTLFGEPLFRGMTRTLAEQLNMSTLAVSPDRTHVAAARRWADRIEIFDPRTAQLERSIAGPVVTKLEFDVTHIRGQDVLTLTPDSAFSYVDVTATDTVILALYSGRLKGDFPAQFGAGSEVHAFSWDGRPMGRWRLPEAVQKIRADQSGSLLYASGSAPNPTVVVYALPRIGPS